MNAKKLAELSGTSVRTLHHYDEIGLLVPKRMPGNGYREYTQGDVLRLAQILFFRQCGFSLDTIRELLDSPAFDRMAAYQLQVDALEHQRTQIDRMLDTLKKTMRAEKGEIKMTDKERFDGLDFSHNPYEEEARQRWGDEAVEKSNAAVQSAGPEGQKKMADEMARLFTAVAGRMDTDPASAEVQGLMEELFRFFNSSVGVTYTYEMFAGLGAMYVADERFTKNIDAYGEGLSAFLKEAMAAFAKAHGADPAVCG